MATDKQIGANRQNAKSSTGPKTEHGKRRSRRNAIRHGLTAETVINVLEDPADYEALEAAINADYRPRTNFELELIARLVSLLWRLRRAVAIESGLLDIQSTTLRKPRATTTERSNKNGLHAFYALIPSLVPTKKGDPGQCAEAIKDVGSMQLELFAKPGLRRSDIARSFTRISNLDNDVFEKLGRYEMRLWRQTVQIILLLNSINRSENDAHADCDDKHFYIRNGSRKHRRILWPPFATSG